MSTTDYYVSFGTTESGDNLVPLIWDRKPKVKEVDEAYKTLYPDEYEETGGVEHTTMEAVVKD